MGKKRVRNNKSNKPMSLLEFQNFQSTIQQSIESVDRQEESVSKGPAWQSGNTIKVVSLEKKTTNTSTTKQSDYCQEIPPSHLRMTKQICTFCNKSPPGEISLLCLNTEYFPFDGWWICSDPLCGQKGENNRKKYVIPKERLIEEFPDYNFNVIRRYKKPEEHIQKGGWRIYSDAFRKSTDEKDFRIPIITMCERMEKCHFLSLLRTCQKITSI